MKFIVVGDEILRTLICTKGSSTVLAAGDTAGISAGLIIKGLAASTKLSYAPFGGLNGNTQIEITEGNDFVLQGTGSVVFAQTYAGGVCDQVDDTNQLIALSTSSTNVFSIDMSVNAGTVGSTAKVRVRLNKPIF